MYTKSFEKGEKVNMLQNTAGEDKISEIFLCFDLCRGDVVQNGHSKVITSHSFSPAVHFL